VAIIQYVPQKNNGTFMYNRGKIFSTVFSTEGYSICNSRAKVRSISVVLDRKKYIDKKIFGILKICTLMIIIYKCHLYFS